MIFHT